MLVVERNFQDIILLNFMEFNRQDIGWELGNQTLWPIVLELNYYNQTKVMVSMHPANILASNYTYHNTLFKSLINDHFSINAANFADNSSQLIGTPSH